MTPLCNAHFALFFVWCASHFLCNPALSRRWGETLSNPDSIAPLLSLLQPCGGESSGRGGAFGKPSPCPPPRWRGTRGFKSVALPTPCQKLGCALLSVSLRVEVAGAKAAESRRIQDALRFPAVFERGEATLIEAVFGQGEIEALPAGRPLWVNGGWSR